MASRKLHLKRAGHQSSRRKDIDPDLGLFAVRIEESQSGEESESIGDLAEDGPAIRGPFERERGGVFDTHRIAEDHVADHAWRANIRDQRPDRGIHASGDLTRRRHRTFRGLLLRAQKIVRVNRNRFTRGEPKQEGLGEPFTLVGNQRDPQFLISVRRIHEPNTAETSSPLAI